MVGLLLKRRKILKQGKVIALLFCCLLFLALHVVPTAQAADTVEFTREYFRGRVLSITNTVPTNLKAI